jgi:ATP-binding cassette subfamily B protein
LNALRAFFAVAPQDSFLFSDSVRNNVLYGALATDSEGEDALRSAVNTAALESDLAVFADGVDTVVGERGLTLSGGQKQRAAIARAVAAEAEVLVLDDSLSAVDAETERTILDNLYRTRKGRATIIISHRVSAFARCDEAAVLEAGRLEEFGPPSVLATAGGRFERMTELQKLG